MPEHTLRRLTAHVWWLNPYADTDRPTLGVVVGSAGSLVVDAGASPAHARALLAELARHALPPPRFVVLTHWHWDHIFGLTALDAPALASMETQRIVGVMAGLDWSDAALDERVAQGREIAFCRDMLCLELPDHAERQLRVPEIGIAAAATLDLGGCACQLIHVGGDHSPDGLVVHVPQDGVVFLGDAIYDDLYHGPRRLTTAQLFPLLDRLLALEADHYVGGHDLEPIPRAQFATDAALLHAIGTTVAQVGDDRAAVLAALPGALGGSLDEERIAIADAFLAGLRLPVVSSLL
jgi:glyoxylase-like metal-dependent hydrolase (beta-lactamase superfamily II)